MDELFGEFTTFIHLYASLCLEAVGQPWEPLDSSEHYKQTEITVWLLICTCTYKGLLN